MAADHPDASRIWSAMVAARPIGSAKMVARLPATGAKHRNPKFWGDLEVRNMVIDHHRQIYIRDLRKLIRDRFGDARTPGTSSIQRAWARLDEMKVRPGSMQGGR
ncbi:MAG: hypothetical protein ACK4TC_09480 [Sphingomonas pseudosanguinis]